MNGILEILLRIAGAGLILLAITHIPIGRRLKWREQGALLDPMNRSVFHVHTFFICLVLVLMGLPCLIDPQIFLDPSPAGRWLAWSCAGFWAFRLYFQFFVYQADLWRGKRMETLVHRLFVVIWTGLAAVFTACGFLQSGWVQ